MKKNILLFILFLSVNKVCFSQINKNEDLSFFKKVMFELFYQKPLRHFLKTSFKNPNNADLSDFIKDMENGEPVPKKTILKETPYSWYIFLGFWYECYKKNISKAIIYKNIANTFRSENALSKRDQFLSSKIVKFYNKYKPCNTSISLKSRDSLYSFIENEIFHYNIKFINEMDSLNKEYDNLVSEIDSLTNRLNIINNDIDSLQNLVLNKKIKIEKLSSQNYEQALSEVNKMKEKGVQNLSGNITKGLSGGAILNISDDISTDPIKPEIIAQGYELNKYCTPKIIDFIDDVIISALSYIDFQSKYNDINLPQNYRDSVKINLVLTGKADGNKISRTGGISNLKYSGDDTELCLYYSYYTKSEKNKIFINGDPIDDDDLAFLRSYCAYKEAKRILELKKFPTSNLNTKFYAIVYTDTGSIYRGVDIKCEIENLFTFNINKINLLKNESKNIESKIAKNEEDKTEIENIIKDKKALNKLRDDEIKKYVEKIKDFQLNTKNK
jgi:hypothetical protein